MIAHLKLSPGFQQYEVGSLKEAVYDSAPEGDTFETYAESLVKHANDPTISRLVILPFFKFRLPDVLLYPDPAINRSMIRFQICRWLIEDRNIPHKPVHVSGFNTYKELRLLSGLPGGQIHSVSAYFDVEDEADAWATAMDFFTSAGDDDAVLRLIEVMP